MASEATNMAVRGRQHVCTVLFIPSYIDYYILYGFSIVILYVTLSCYLSQIIRPPERSEGGGGIENTGS